MFMCFRTAFAHLVITTSRDGNYEFTSPTECSISSSMFLLTPVKIAIVHDILYYPPQKKQLYQSDILQDPQ